jgi:two-component system osmolarity sensor histidine kinase EnvZ
LRYCSCATRSSRSCAWPTPPKASARGREAPNFRPRGAREARRAAQAFLEMKSRIERSIEQRTAMLAGVSHDLRTILTRFKLELS